MKLLDNQCLSSFIFGLFIFLGICKMSEQTPAFSQLIPYQYVCHMNLHIILALYLIPQISPSVNKIDAMQPKLWLSYTERLLVKSLENKVVLLSTCIQHMYLAVNNAYTWCRHPKPPAWLATVTLLVL